MLTQTPKELEKNYIEIKSIFSEGSIEVYEVIDSSGNSFALKLYKIRKFLKKIIKEIQIGIYLNNQKGTETSFIKYITSETDINSKHTFIIYELAQKYTLKDKLLSRKYFDEKLSKIIFWDIGHKINNLHKIGIAHMNLNLENILLDNNYNIKIAGFSSAQFIIDKQNGIKEDIFQLGVILLQLISGKCDKKILEDKCLKIMKKGGCEFFWNLIEDQSNIKFSKEIKELITVMLSIKFPNGQKEWTLDEILNKQEWFDSINSFENSIYMMEAFKLIEESG
jgi:serine/threonine protein kinase